MDSAAATADAVRASDAAEQDDEDEAVTLAAVFIGQALLANLMSLLPSIGDPRVHGRIGGLEATASALQDSLSFNLFVEVLQQVQQQNLLPTLLLLRIVGYSNADLRKSLSPQQQRRVWQLQQQAAEGKWVPQNAAAAAFAATHLETEGAQEDCATDRSASSSKIGRRKKKWAQRPLYVPPLQLQRSLRTLCRLLPQLRRLELLHPQAAATAPTQAGAAPAFSRLHRLIAYVSPFSVLAESLGFQLLSIKITELLQCCACCCSGWCSASKLCSSHGMHCTEASGGMRRINGSGVSGIDSSSSVDSSAESSEDSGKEQQCSSVKCSSPPSSACCSSSKLPPRSFGEADGISGVLRRTACARCDFCPAVAAGELCKRLYVLESVIFSRAEELLSRSTTAAAAYSESEFAGSTGFHKKPVQITTQGLGGLELPQGILSCGLYFLQLLRQTNHRETLAERGGSRGDRQLRKSLSVRKNLVVARKRAAEKLALDVLLDVARHLGVASSLPSLPLVCTTRTRLMEREGG
ncbi:hypothetical protein cyc_08987 [Cyclospora cayetanensis]|uniref:Uncharacterized protein n=1 Tax=Cyclospora cayetanensis TaxID=88456 RepID=A0A1D3D3P7_9EIME|nr:hypothetical protein cyc_08987 [Cyclospora cayetanensis]